MKEAFKQEVVLASAGTGKTFSLSNTYLHLITKGIDAKDILASTFTRKASSEIFNRIFERLIEALENPEKIKELKDLNIIPQEYTQKELGKITVELSRQIHQIKILTIDAYFNQLATTNRAAVKMPLKWRTAEPHETKATISKAIQRYFESHDEKEVEFLITTLSDKDAPRSFLNSVIQATSSILDSARESTKDSWLKSFGESNTKITWNQLLKKAEALPPPIDRKGAHKRKNKLIEAIQEEHLDKIFETCTFKNNYWYNKPISDEWVAFIEDAKTFLKQKFGEQLKKRNATFEKICSSIAEEIESINRQRKTYSFNDINHQLIQAIKNNEIKPNKNLHLLLDEFQDTSVPQWQAIRPQIETTLSQKNRSFIVGDAKQAIYGWRSGESEILLGLEKKYKLESNELKKNYRSSPTITNFVNKLFQGIGEYNPNDTNTKSLFENFKEKFPHHSAVQKKNGTVWVLKSNNEEQYEKKDHCLKIAAERAISLHKEAPHKEIGILVRNKRGISKIQSLLRSEGVLASVESETGIADSEAVEIVLSWINSIFYLGDTLSRFHATHSAQTNPFNTPKDWKDDYELYAKKRRREIATKGFALFLRSHLQKIKNVFKKSHDHLRLSQLVEIAEVFDSLEEEEPEKFTDFVRESKVSNQSRSPIKLMTIHASKGLQFDAVILPEVDESFWGNFHKSKFLSKRKEIDGPITQLSSYKKIHAELLNELKDIEQDAKSKHINDSLCVLYVALTRAKERLEIITQKEPKKSEKDCYANLIRESLSIKKEDEPLSSQSEWDLIYEEDESNPQAWADSSKKLTAKDQDKRSRLSIVNEKESEEIETLSPSQNETNQTKLKGFQGFQAHLAAQRGSRIHEILSQCTWLEDFKCDDEEVLKIIKRKKIYDALCKPASGDYSVWQEKPFAVVVSEKSNQRKILRGVYDRVVLKHDAKGQFESAEIIDFKTGHVSQEKREQYQEQLSKYAQALSQQTGLPLSSIDTTLLELDE